LSGSVVAVDDELTPLDREWRERFVQYLMNNSDMGFYTAWAHANSHIPFDEPELAAKVLLQGMASNDFLG
jgi:hypothetical protein